MGQPERRSSMGGGTSKYRLQNKTGLPSLQLVAKDNQRKPHGEV